MRLRSFGEPEQVLAPELLDLDDESPQPSSCEVVVEVAAAGVNFPDLLIVQGELIVQAPRPLDRSTAPPRPEPEPP